MSTYDTQSHVIEESYYGTDGQPVNTRFGHARWEAEYDAQDRRVSYFAYTADNRPYLGAGGFAGWRRRYDAAGNVVESAFSRDKDRLVNCVDGYARCVLVYDAKDKITGADNFGPDGRPVQLPGGFASWRIVDGQVNAFDLDGKPVQLVACSRATASSPMPARPCAPMMTWKRPNVLPGTARDRSPCGGNRKPSRIP